MQTTFLSFANKAWHAKTKPLQRIGQEAQQMGVFDRILLYDEDDLGEDYCHQYHDRFSERSFGYWQWKSHLVKREMQTMQE